MMKSEKRNPKRIYVTLFLLLTAVIVGKSDAQDEKRVIIVSGQEAHGTNGAVFASSIPGRRTSMPMPLAISDEGKVVFRARLEPGIGDATDDNQFGIWAKEKDDFTLLAREQSEVPGLAGQIFTKLPEVFMDLAGQIGLDATYSPTGEEPETHGFFVEEDGDMVLKVYDGMTVLPGIILEGFEVAGFNMGRIIIRGWLEGEGIESDNDLIAAKFDQSGFNILFREGNPMPIVAGDYVNEWIGFHTTLDMNGNTIVWIQGKNNSTNQRKEAVYYWEQPGWLSLILDSDSTPLIPVFGNNNWRLNASGNIVNMGDIGDGYILSMKKNGDFLRVAARGDSADGTDGATFTTFGRWIGNNHYHKCVLHDNNSVSVLAETSDRKTGIWMGDETGLKKVVYRGDQASGLEDGLLFSDVSGIEANAAGQVAISIGAGGRDSDGNWVDFIGIWFGDSEGLQLVLKTDDQFEIEPEIFKTIEYVCMTSLLTTPVDRPRTGADGWPTCVNDNGEILLALNFDDGGNALIVTSPIYTEFVVNSTDDDVDNNPGNGKCECDGPKIEGKPKCTLRAAIMEANAKEGKDRITYSIPTSDAGYDSAAGTFIIQPGTALPPCTDPVDIIGNTTEPPEPLSKMAYGPDRQQEGPEEILDGSRLNSDEDGIHFSSGTEESSILNHVILQFPGNGITIESDHFKVQNCVIGTEDLLSHGFGNRGYGIEIKNASNVLIGGSTHLPGFTPGNVISNNLCGIFISGTRAKDNMIRGNVIGAAFYNDPPLELGNVDGVIIDNSPHNFIGGDDERTRNVISGNTQNGIVIRGEHATNNTVEGNFIGVDRNGENAIGNGERGIHIFEARENSIGRKTDRPGVPPGNVISGNGTGIVIEQQSDHAGNNRIEGNLIGTTAHGDAKLSNKIGILISQADSIIVGGKDTKARNIISGSTQDGIQIRGANATENRVEGNYIGTDWTGEKAIGNDTTGIHILDASGNSIGGQTDVPGTPPGNVISGNGTGIVIERGSGNARNNRIEGNLIGTTAHGDTALGNNRGVEIRDASGNSIGDSTVTGRNVISSSTIANISIMGTDAMNNKVLGNLIGLSITGKDSPGKTEITTLYGVSISGGASENYIGRPTPEPGNPPGNVISGQEIGIKIDASKNQVLGNFIGPGIEGIRTYHVHESEDSLKLFNGNSRYGIEIAGDDNIIGGMDSTARNVISGNNFENPDSLEGFGISILEHAEGNKVFGNYIGVGPDGTTPEPNAGGILITGFRNYIGEPTINPGDPPGNIISGYGYGILLRYGSSGNLVQGNLIGIGADGKSLSSRFGITVEHSCGNTLGGSEPGAGNIIAESDSCGISIYGYESSENEILGNYVGLNKYGILIHNADHNTIGAIKSGVEDTLSQNRIDANHLAGIRLEISRNNDIVNNIFSYNGIGIWLEDLGRMKDYPDNNEIANNIFSDNEAGIRLENSYNNEIVKNLIHSNRSGVELNWSWFDVIINNQFRDNETHILMETGTSSLIHSNSIINGSGFNSGIHLDNARAEIVGNSITDDAGDGITLENGADASVFRNNIFGNQGFGLNNTDESVLIIAQDNWWGNASGPGGEGSGSGDEVSTGVDYANWRTKMVSLVVSTGFDTIYTPSGEADSVNAFVRNWQYPTEAVEMSVTDDLGWVQEPTTFLVTLDESFGGSAPIQFTVPGDTEEGTVDNVTVTAVSQTDTNTIETDSFLVLAYGPVLTQIFVTPDSVILSPSDTVQFVALGIDQFNLTLDFAPIWSATCGTIDETGLYTAGEEEGVYVVTATDATGAVQGQAHVEIRGGVGVEGDEEISDHLIPTEFYLSQNYPNPFNPVTTIEYALPEAAQVRIKVYNIIGQVVKVLINSSQPAGFHSIQWNTSGLASGVYFYRLEAGQFVATKKMLLLK
ncbi:MAG: right-handed parallel beta-helix repeat-containing protein [Gemmatimonadota bacterium]|nr:MAG: right-handed parallel beta-helix repeat-containing protein [Gemmatimonadota bacterium]